MLIIDGKQYLTIDQAALLMGVSVSRVSQFLTAKRLRAATILGRRLLLADEVRNFHATRRRTPGPIPRQTVTS